MKKLVSYLLCVVMLLSLMPAAFAADEEGLANAIILAKSRIAVPDSYTEFSSDMQTDDQGSSVYALSWETGEDALTYGRIYVRVNSYGDVISYNHSFESKDYNNIRFANFSGEELKQIAIDWLSAVNPHWMAELPVDLIEYPKQPNARYHSDSVLFTRQIDGIDYCNDNVSVSINNLTGEVESMYANRTYETPSYKAEEAMDIKAAEAAFLSQSPMKLQYEQADETHATLVYTPEKPYLQLNARTGEEFEVFNPYREYGASGGGSAMAEDTATEESVMDKNSFTESELKSLEEVEGLLSQEVLCATVEGLKNTGLDKAQFTSIAYDSYKEEKDGETVTKYRAYLSYTNKEEKTTYYQVSMDALTGELLNYHSYPSNYNEEEAALSLEAAEKKAEAFLSAYAAEEWKAVKLREEERKPSEDYYLTYVRHANDIPFERNYLNVTVDKKNGRIKSFYKNWNREIEFASPEGIISAEAAGKRLMEQSGMVLTYAKAQNGDSTVPLIDLRYTLNNQKGYEIDAKSGSLTITLHEEEELTLPTDIAGHYAEDRIIKLMESGILEDTLSFRPDEMITQKEMLAFACGLKMGYIPYNIEYASLANRAGGYGITSISAEPDAPVSREMAVAYIIQALGYEEVAKLQQIFVTKFNDQAQVSPGMLGYLALAQGLNIVHGDENGNFNPREHITRSDAAILLYNYLSR